MKLGLVGGARFLIVSPDLTVVQRTKEVCDHTVVKNTVYNRDSWDQK